MDEELSKDIKALGFPIEHKHKLCCLRQELLDSFVDSRYMMFIKYAAYHLQQLNLKSKEETLNNVQDKAIKNEEEKSDNKQNGEDNKNTDNRQIETEEAKRIVESIADGSRLERECSMYF